MLPVLILSVIFGSLSVTAIVLGLRYMSHRERIAELEVRQAQALAQAQIQSQAALPSAREQLAEELLEAYDEADKALKD